MMKDGEACGAGKCDFHPKAPIVAGGLIILFTLLGMNGSPVFLWLDVVVGALLIYAGVSGTCYLSKALCKIWPKCSDKGGDKPAA